MKSRPSPPDHRVTVFRLSSDHAKSRWEPDVRASIGFPCHPLRDVVGTESGHGCLRPTPEGLIPYARISLREDLGSPLQPPRFSPLHRRDRPMGHGRRNPSRTPDPPRMDRISGNTRYSRSGSGPRGGLPSRLLAGPSSRSRIRNPLPSRGPIGMKFVAGPRRSHRRVKLPPCRATVG